MQNVNQAVRLASIGLIVSTILLVLLNVFFEIDLTLPAIFLLLGAGFCAAALIFSGRWTWLAALYIPGCTFLTLGIIFLFNVLTKDWSSWAYAWLLGVAGLGAGTVLAGKMIRWRQEITMAAVGLAVIGTAGFGLFGAIAGGPFLTVIVPVLLIAAAAFLYLVPADSYLGSLLMKGRPSPGNAITLPKAQVQLIEPLSSRELEVLQLIDLGLSNAEIASRLTLANSTIKTHINNIYGKLGVQTRVQALKRAQQLGLLKENRP